jgi:hypothetical protein
MPPPLPVTSAAPALEQEPYGGFVGALAPTEEIAPEPVRQHTPPVLPVPEMGISALAEPEPAALPVLEPALVEPPVLKPVVPPPAPPWLLEPVDAPPQPAPAPEPVEAAVAPIEPLPPIEAKPEEQIPAPGLPAVLAEPVAPVEELKPAEATPEQSPVLEPVAAAPAAVEAVAAAVTPAPKPEPVPTGTLAGLAEYKPGNGLRAFRPARRNFVKLVPAGGAQTRLEQPGLVSELVAEPQLRPSSTLLDVQDALKPRPVTIRYSLVNVARPVEMNRRAEIPSEHFSGTFVPLSGLVSYTAAAKAKMRAVSNMARIQKVDSSPKVTLPGPSLPPQLTTLHGAGLSVVPGYSLGKAGTSARSWLLTGGVTLVTLAIVFAASGYLFQSNPGSSESQPEKQAPAVAQANTTPSVAAGGSPLSKYVEVTGFRFVVDLNKKSEIHYLVVNHSAAQLGGITVWVTLRSASAKAGQPPFTRFSFRAPDLGPFESREMVSTIEKLPRTLTLPEWQDLRPDIEIGQ